GWFALVALTLFHHMTDYVFSGFLSLWALVSCFQASGRRIRVMLVVFGLTGLAFALTYMFLMPGNPVRGYLSTYFVAAVSELHQVLDRSSQGRKLFSAQGAPPAPLWDRLLMLGSVGLVTFGIFLGVVSLWKQWRKHALIIVMSIVALASPVTQLFRFTNYGAEITDRSAAFLFIAISFVLAVLISRLWPVQRFNWRAAAIISCLMTVLVLGGTLLEIGPAYSSLPGPYTVIADGRSVEPIGIAAANWSLVHLGSGNRFASDRMNQIVFGTFGKQYIVTQPQDGFRTAPIFFDLPLTSKDVNNLEDANIKYLISDQRLSTSLPLLGFYFETDEPNAFHQRQPISRAALTKFNNIDLINKIFDDGTLLIYDVVPLEKSLFGDDD
ncbi:MAG TPA: hypothetical protein VFN23_00220, partial [Ktedonobacteraceae bacterium]|nr:hypothetical protein [Ktedonobacteraceae bacterium]